MGEQSGIQWTNATWNPWQGCTKVSPGCASCYMYRDKHRWGKDPSVVVRSSHGTFNLPLRFSDHKLVFTCSWSDWFHEAADEWREEAWDIIRRTPHLTYQILTKRIENLPDRLPADWGAYGYPNVWLGVSVENQRMTYRVERLIEIPARLRFVSAEPLLREISLDRYLTHQRIHWVIVGGESGGRHGHPARKMERQWVERLYHECRTHDVAFFFKQWGGQGAPLSHERALLFGREYKEMPVCAPPQKS